MNIHDEAVHPDGAWRQDMQASVRMLRQVLDGLTYDEVAVDHRVSRTAVEHRIKLLLSRLIEQVGVEGLGTGTGLYARRLREHREAILSALDRYDPVPTRPGRTARVLDDVELQSGAMRIARRSSRPWHDLALYHLLLATGLRPLEVARLTVGDHLQADGRVRRHSVLRAHAAINGRARPLHFLHGPLNEALGRYLEERYVAGHGLGHGRPYRGLAPDSALFLGPSGEHYPIGQEIMSGMPRQLCRPMLENYRRVFRFAEVADLSTQSARLTLAARMYLRGAQEDQIGEVLGLVSIITVQRLLPRPRRSLAELLAFEDVQPLQHEPVSSALTTIPEAAEQRPDGSPFDGSAAL